MSGLTGRWRAELPDAHGTPRGLSDWLRERLFQRRIVLVTGYLDEFVAGESAAALMSLGATGDGPIDIHVDCVDGTLGAAFVLIDVVDGLRAPVRIHCRGQVGGPVIGVVAAGDHRSSTPHARFRLGQPVSRFAGTPEQIAAQSRQQQELLWRFYARLAQATGQPAEEIAEDVRRGRCLTAHEALEYGLISEVTAGR